MPSSKRPRSSDVSGLTASPARPQHDGVPDSVIDQYTSLESTIFPSSTYILVQKAMVYYLERQYDEAEALFEEVLQRDPYRLEQMDAYSNILYVKEKDAKLSFLAHNAIKWDKYRPETCCIIGNYYSVSQRHLPPYFLGHFSPVLRRLFTVLSRFPAFWRQDGETGRKMA